MSYKQLCKSCRIYPYRLLLTKTSLFIVRHMQNVIVICMLQRQRRQMRQTEAVKMLRDCMKTVDGVWPSNPLTRYLNLLTTGGLMMNAFKARMKLETISCKLTFWKCAQKASMPSRHNRHISLQKLRDKIFSAGKLITIHCEEEMCWQSHLHCPLVLLGIKLVALLNQMIRPGLPSLSLRPQQLHFLLQRVSLSDGVTTLVLQWRQLALQTLRLSQKQVA